MDRKTYRVQKLSPLEREVLRKIKNRQVRNIERQLRIDGKPVLHPRTAKPVTASYVNISNAQVAQFRKLERKGLISAFGKTEYFTNFRLTEKGKAQFRRQK